MERFCLGKQKQRNKIQKKILNYHACKITQHSVTNGSKASYVIQRQKPNIDWEHEKKSERSVSTTAQQTHRTKSVPSKRKAEAHLEHRMRECPMKIRSNRDPLYGKSPILNIIMDTMLCSQTGALPKCPMRDSTQQLTEKKMQRTSVKHGMDLEDS